MPGLITRCEMVLAWRRNSGMEVCTQWALSSRVRSWEHTQAHALKEDKLQRQGGPLPARKDTSENRCAMFSLERDPPWVAAGDVMDFSGLGSGPGDMTKHTRGHH